MRNGGDWVEKRGKGDEGMGMEEKMGGEERRGE